MDGINKRGVIKRTCAVFAVFLLLFVGFGVVSFGEESQVSDLDKSGRMITETVVEEVVPNYSSSSQIELDAFMVACLVVVGGSLGMVLLSMKLGRNENTEK